MLVRSYNSGDEVFPTLEEIKVLSRTELIGFRIAERMNRGWLKDLMTFLQRYIGSLWIKICTYNLMNVFGLENFEKTDPNRPILLVANHRSFFDMYVVSAMLFRMTNRRFYLYFPVRARFFYDSPLGWFVNFIMGWFSMFPPFFREVGEAKKREFDKFSLRFLIRICSENKPNIVGFHPEGRRNLNSDAYSFLPAQPGVGKLIMESKPQVVPIFITGLGNNLLKQVIGNWTNGEKIRIWFGEPLDLSEYFSKPNRLRTHKEIADFLMEKIKLLAEKDKLWIKENYERDRRENPNR
jgi:1-acyl-sn-glycerol-3-phosphate acyltransferase